MNIKLLNKIAKCGTCLFDEKYTVAEDVADADAIMVRSASMHEMDFEPSLLAIARAGAGVNNIPLDRAADAGIVVFNTPGANANAVKELAVAALLLSCRKIVDGINWAKTIDSTEDVAKAVEKGKGAFVGPELLGKTLGVVGLGAIGAMVANTALDLGMKVVGYDPFLSVKAALALDSRVSVVTDLDELYKAADFITLHIPSTPDTKGSINANTIAKMKDGVRILNLARADLVNTADIKAALDSDKVAAYVVDFPTNDLCEYKNVVAIPHLGASTPESEDNCAVMAAQELINYLENGNVVNSVNYPSVSAPRNCANRVCVLYKACDEALAEIAAITKTANVTNAVKKGYGYAIVDSNDAIDAVALEALSFVIKTRTI
ncbi:MAG: 3-phosphoglycerate dehydrogenase [Clostridia bacterium]|nr:3-phosphoglycerate dehydrogenase [Clostridia bacterium]